MSGGGSATTGGSVNAAVPHCCAPPTPQSSPPPPASTPPPPPPLPNAGLGGGDVGLPIPLLVVPRSAEIHAAEAMLESALVVLVGGTRPFVSPAMVYQYLHTTYDITHDDVDVRRHHPEDFVVRFRSRVDRDRVLSARPGGALLPLIWRPWRRTSMASAASFRFGVLVALANVPLHARSVMTVQVVLGKCCASIKLTALQDILEDDDREFFVTAWCWDPSFIVGEQPIFIPEPQFQAGGSAAPGLRYLVRIHVVASQNFATPPASPPADGGTSNDGLGGDGDDADDFWPTPRRDSEDDDSDDSNHNRRHLGFGSQRTAERLAIQVGKLACRSRLYLLSLLPLAWPAAEPGQSVRPLTEPFAKTQSSC